MMGELLRAAGEASLSAAVMVLAVLVLRLRFQDRTPRRAFCLLWDIVLVRLLMLGALPSPVSIRRWLPALRTHLTRLTPDAAVIGVTGAELVQGTWQLVPSEAAEGTIQFVTIGTAQTAQAPAADWSGLLAGAWLGVALLLAAGFLWNHLRSRQVYAASLPVRDSFVLDWLEAHPLRRPVRARYSDRIAAPLTYGVLYPVILLPRGMDREDELSCVLAHEHEHIRRFDALRKLFLAAALCLHWFNPLVWAMYALAERDIELACDEAALRGGADREQYALALLSMEERRGRWSPSGSHFSGHALEERIRAIMKRKHISITALVALLVVMSITTTVFASAAPEAKAEPQGEAQTSLTGVSSYLQAVEDASVSVISRPGEDGGKLYSVDGGDTWMDEDRYHAEYGGDWGDSWKVEWWTAEEYEAWLEQEKEELQSIIGERSYTGGEGWFVWDQERIDEAIARYEQTLEEIKNGALYSMRIVDRDGREVEDVALGYNGPFIASIREKLAEHETALREMWEKLKEFGVEENGDQVTYNGQLVRYLVDGVAAGDSGYSIAHVYYDEQGTVDIHTLRAIIFNPDGSYDPMGDLIGVAAAGDRDFDQGLIDCAAFSSEPSVITYYAITQGESTEHGRTFEEIFADYEGFGLIYLPRESGMGALDYNGLPVRYFADLKPDGSAFTYEDPYTEEGLKISVSYAQDGQPTGLLASPIPVKDISQEKRELGFETCTPVQGQISAAFSQGQLQFHYGVDLAAKKGTDVAAFAAGTASEAGFSAQYGNYVVLAHEGGYSTLYAHCLSVAVAEGDSVAMGQKIAEVGASGMVTGPALHFELRDGDTYLDPAAYLDLRI